MPNYYLDRRGNASGFIFFFIIGIFFTGTALFCEELELTLSLIINGTEKGYIPILLPREEYTEPKINGQALSLLLEDELRLELLEELQNESAVNEWLDLQFLDDLGISTDFNNQELSLLLDIPLEIQSRTDINIFSTKNVSPDSLILPSPFSFYINGRVQAAYVAEPGLHQFPYALTADAAVNLYSWVLEGGVTHGFEGDAGSFYVRPGSIRLVKDFPSPALRMVVGDLSFGIQGFQNFSKLQGISLTRLFDLNPDCPYDDLGEREINLETASQVEVFINEVKVKTLELPAGRYSLRDFVIKSGINIVKIVMTDAAGRVEEMEFKLPFDSKLLPRGELLFSAAAGIPQYSLEIPKFSGYLSYGFNDFLTGGFNLQLDSNQGMAGLRFSLATVAGAFGLDGAASYIPDLGIDGAIQFQYRYENSRLPKVPVFFVGLTYKGMNFGPLEVPSPNNPYSVSILSSVNLRLPWDINVSLGGTVDIGREANGSLYGISLSGSKSLFENMSTRLGLNFDFGEDVPFTWEGSLIFSAHLRSVNSYTSTEHDLQTGRSNITWSTRSEKHVGGLSVSGGISGMPVSDDWDQTVFAGLDYSGYRIQTSVSETFSYLQTSDDIPSSRLSIRAASALVFAGGKLAVSAPVNDSFLIVAPEGRLKEGSIGINPVSGTYTAKSGILSPAVLPSLRSYTYGRAYIESPDLPIDFELGNAVYNLYPGYKSGTRIQIGSKAAVYAKGTLVDKRGEVIALKVGEAVRINTEALFDDAPAEAEVESFQFFTDKSGEFFIYDLHPGAYELFLYAMPDVRINFTIPETAEGRVDIKEIIMPAVFY